MLVLINTMSNIVYGRVKEQWIGVLGFRSMQNEEGMQKIGVIYIIEC